MAILPKDHFHWLMGRLADVYVQGNVPEGGISAWEEGGQWGVWKTRVLTEAELDAMSAPPSKEEFLSRDTIRMLQRYHRESRGNTDEPFPQIIDPNTLEIDCAALQSELDHFLESSMEDFDFQLLQSTGHSVLHQPDPAMMRFAGIRPDYFRCPIPENITPTEIAWANERLALKAPRR